MIIWSFPLLHYLKMTKRNSNTCAPSLISQKQGPTMRGSQKLKLLTSDSVTLLHATYSNISNSYGPLQHQAALSFATGVLFNRCFRQSSSIKKYAFLTRVRAFFRIFCVVSKNSNRRLHKISAAEKNKSFSVNKEIKSFSSNKVHQIAT